MLEHGGNLQDAIIRFGRPREGWIDLSTGINPIGFPAPALPADCWHRLPENDPALIRAATDYYGATRLLAVAGTQAAIQALPRLRANTFGALVDGEIYIGTQANTVSRVVVAAPTYAEHAHQWSSAGHAVRQVAFEKLGEALDDCDVMIVCNPNNPTGATLLPEQLLAWADRLASRGGWLVVDEAFGDVLPALSVVGHTNRPGLIVLRSIGKFFGLAGLRLGFVAAEPSILSSLTAMLGPWTISSPAQQIGIAALNDRAWQHATHERLAADGLRLSRLLFQHGLRSRGCALYQWCASESVGEAERLWRQMAEHGIWIRLFRDAACGVRFGLPPDKVGWQRLEKALSCTLNSLPENRSENFE